MRKLLFLRQRENWRKMGFAVAQSRAIFSSAARDFFYFQLKRNTKQRKNTATLRLNGITREKPLTDRFWHARGNILKQNCIIYVNIAGAVWCPLLSQSPPFAALCRGRVCRRRITLRWGTHSEENRIYFRCLRSNRASSEGGKRNYFPLNWTRWIFVYTSITWFYYHIPSKRGVVVAAGSGRCWQ